MAANPSIVVACLDVGSVGNTGWAVLDDGIANTGRDLDSLVRALVEPLMDGRRLALGFECPLYVPRRSDPRELTKRRAGEIGVNWCGGPGGSVLATGIVQVGWVLEQIAARAPKLVGTTRWREFADGRAQIWVWEAFVTSKAGAPVALEKLGEAGRTPHEMDALAATLEASKRLRLSDGPRSDLAEAAGSSIAGMQLIAAGLAADTGLLTEPCIVIKARKPQ